MRDFDEREYDDTLAPFGVELCQGAVLLGILYLLGSGLRILWHYFTVVSPYLLILTWVL